MNHALKKLILRKPSVLFGYGNLSLSKRKASKGEASLIIHAILVAASITFIIIVVATFSSLKTSYQELTAKNELRELCFLTNGGIEKIYLKTRYTPATNTTLGKMTLLLPERIAEFKYRMNFTENKLYIDTPDYDESCTVGLNITLKGFASGSLVELIFTKYSNGTEEVEMRNV